MTSLSLANRQDIRTHVRHLRQALSTQQQQQAAEQAAERALNFAPVEQAQHIALFLSVDGELNTRPLIAKLWQQKKQVYLPVLHPFCRGQLLFVRYDASTLLQPNRLHIPEPPLNVLNLLPVSALDVILMPLVAFDPQGNRLGMGGGFYDRSLQNWQNQRFMPIGLAHDCQQVDKLPVAQWDVPLSAMITPSRVWQW